MQLFSIDAIWITGLIIIVVWLLNFAERLFGKSIANIDQQLVSSEAARLRREYDERMEAVRKACDERIAALRGEYEKRINELESQIEILFELLRQSNMAPQMAVIERQHEAKKAERKIPHVLGIWPQSDLNISQERDAVYNAGFEYRALTGDQVKRSEILRELRTGKVKILELGAHGDANGIFVNGVNLSAGWWENALRNRGVEVAVILACFSDTSVADAMRRAGVQNVIAVSGEIEDTAAIEFAQQFYQLYADGATVARAFDEARLALDYKQAEKLVLR